MINTLNITPEDCRFIVKPEERMVICLIEGTSTLFLNFAKKNLKIPYNCADCRKSSDLTPRLFMPKYFKGVAICSPNDEWDEEIGKLIAYSRAKDSLNQSFFKRANLYIHTFDRYLGDASDFLNHIGDKLMATTNRRHAKIAELVGEDTNGVSEN